MSYVYPMHSDYTRPYPLFTIPALSSYSSPLPYESLSHTSAF